MPVGTALARIMHHASRFCPPGRRPHAIDPSSGSVCVNSLWNALGIDLPRRRLVGARSPVAQGPDGIRPSATAGNSAPSGRRFHHFLVPSVGVSNFVQTSSVDRRMGNRGWAPVTIGAIARQNDTPCFWPQPRMALRLGFFHKLGAPVRKIGSVC
jgi:hypothetical protein